MNTMQTTTKTAVRIKVLGLGCANCRRLEANTREAVRQLAVSATFEKVDDISDIMTYGIMRTPGLVVNERVIVSGRVPSVVEIASLLAAELD